MCERVLTIQLFLLFFRLLNYFECALTAFQGEMLYKASALLLRFKLPASKGSVYDRYANLMLFVLSIYISDVLHVLVCYLTASDSGIVMVAFLFIF